MTRCFALDTGSRVDKVDTVVNSAIGQAGELFDSVACTPFIGMNCAAGKDVLLYDGKEGFCVSSLNDLQISSCRCC